MKLTYLNLSNHYKVIFKNKLFLLFGMTEMMCLKDSYAKEFEAEVVKVDSGKYVVLDKTLFYAVGGGQPCDEGKLICGGEYKVIFVKKVGGELSHEVDKEGLKVGDKVKGIIDWEKRYKLMRYHTATHVLSSLMHNEGGVLITGNQLGVDKTRIDFNLEEFSKEKIEKYIDMAKEVIGKGGDVKVYFMGKEDALKDEGVVKLANREFLEKLDEVRIVEIVGVDKQLDGGTHVKNLNEIGKLKLLKVENKGKNNRRVYFEIE